MSGLAPRSPFALGAALCALATVAACSADEAAINVEEPRDASVIVPVAGDASTSSFDAGAPNRDGGTASPSDASASSADAANISPHADGGVASPRTLKQNEVSVLFPLPSSSADVAAQLAPDTAGAGGPLVPRALYDRSAPLLTALTPEETHARLRVVSMRVDPCPQRLTDRACAPELRLVFQPISGDGASTTTEDAALHAVYGVPSAALASLLAELRALGDAEPELAYDLPLQIHPVMLRQGLQGGYAAGLRALIVRHAGEGSLQRLTFMQLSGRANVWIFGGFDRTEGGSFVPTRIAGLTEETQRITHNVFTDDLSITVSPSVIDGDDFSLLYDSSTSRGLTPDQRRPALEAALRVENPERHDPDSVDCARCHVAFVARRWHERVLGDDTSQSSDRFVAPPFDLTVPEIITPPTSLRTFRAFGWLAREPAISQRTANDTAQVCRELRQ